MPDNAAPAAFLRDESRRYKPMQPSVAAQFIALANRQ